MTRSTKLIFGCGYVGLRAARAWRAASARVIVVTRSADRAHRFAEEGLEPLVADITRPDTLAHLPAAATVLFSVGYDRKQTLPIGDVYAGGLKNALEALPTDTDRVIYISSTGVYGDAAGDRVDEETPCRPEREGGRACLAAEQVLASHSLGQRGIVLRLAGIYGPGRVPRREDLLANRTIPASGDGYLNLIHVDDAVRVILAAETAATPPRTYNVSDGNPAPRCAYYQELARLLSAPEPRFDPAANSAAERTRGGSDKQVSNARMLAELGAELQYPSFREGLAAIIDSSRESL